ncbi:hypothetical protein ACQE3E_09925 [Methylomonas sp. MED-D]|uniref:hypothetical protein n=1 Tax=Methylomonas sp. MED-D TaxID=3418768 RepID=UPI003D08AC18
MSTLSKLSYFSRRTLWTLPLSAALSFGSLSTAAATSFSRVDLVTDDQAANPAQITDTSLVNAWGISYAPTGPF